MSESNPPPPDRAGLYVLGLLRGEERREFEAEMAVDPLLAFEVAAWEERLLPLALSVEPVQPGEGVWGTIERAVAPRPARAASAAPAVSGLRAWLWDNLVVWRAVGAMGVAAAIILAVLPRTAPTTSMIAVLSTASGPVFTVSMRPDGRMDISSVGHMAPPPGKVWQLWAVMKGHKPMSLGIMHRGNMVLPAGDMPAHMRKARPMIAATVEPPGGSPTGRPDMPIVFSGQLLPVGRGRS